MGKGIPGSSVTVVDDEGNSVPANTKGNIEVPLDLPALSKDIIKSQNVRRKRKQVNTTSLVT